MFESRTAWCPAQPAYHGCITIEQCANFIHGRVNSWCAHRLLRRVAPAIYADFNRHNKCYCNRHRTADHETRGAAMLEFLILAVIVLMILYFLVLIGLIW